MNIRVEFTAAEAGFLVNLLNHAYDRMSCNGCNDYPVPNTDENWALFKEVTASAGCEEETRPRDDQQIFFMDWMLLGYFRSRIVKAMS